MNEKKREKGHREKKNPHSAELHAAARKAKNAERPKQRWVGGETVKDGGHWAREADASTSQN